MRGERAEGEDDVLDASVSGVSNGLVIEASEEAGTNECIEDVVCRSKSALGGKESGEKGEGGTHFGFKVGFVGESGKCQTED